MSRVKKVKQNLLKANQALKASKAKSQQERSEKIRTYNYPQNRVTDHRIGFTIQQLDRVMEGELDDILDALIHYDQAMKISGEE